MKRKTLFILSLVLILSFVFSACSTTPEATEASDVEEPADEEEETASGSLIVYTNSGSGGRDAWLIEQAAEAGFDIEVLEGGGGDISNRIIAEKENPIADVVFGLNTMTYASMKTMDIFEQYEPVWASEVTSGLNDPEHYYHGIVMQAIFLIYNSEMYDETTAPSDWPDLWNNEEYHSLYWLPASLGGGTTRTVISGILVRHRDENGEFSISEEGWSEIEKYFKYGTYEVEGEDFYSWLASGKTPFGQMWSSGIAQREEQYGVEAGLVGPEVGVPYVVEQVAILKGTNNLQLAKDFVDWFGSAEFQKKWAEEWDTMPANTLAVEGASENMQNIFSTYPPQDIDWDFVSENIESWVEKIELQYFMAQ